jgi:protein involved in polysaccharide export with SLBB domain
MVRKVKLCHDATSVSQGRRLGIALVAGAVALLAAHGVAGAASSGIVMLDPQGKEKPVAAEEVAKLGGENPPYLLQVGDAVSVAFRMATLRENQPMWDYRIEVGDSMEVRLSPDLRSDREYLIEVGDVVAVSFLDNWELSVTRTVRVDGRISVPEVGDVEAAGKTAQQLRDTLKGLYAKTGIVQGEPKITVNVDFVNLDRFDSMSRDVTVRANGAIRLPQFTTDVQVAGLTVNQACEAIRAEASKVLRNPPVAGINVFPAVNGHLNEMKGLVVVQPDGKISVPGLTTVQAAGFSIDELRPALAKACQGLCYNPIEPLLSLMKATGARFYVGGEVRIPGVYPLDASPTVLQALIMAQGLTDNSRMKSVIILRRNPQGKPFVIKTNLRAAVSKGYTENDVPLRAFDTVYVPKKTISKIDLFVDQYIDKAVPFSNTLGINANYYVNEQKVDSVSRNRNFGFNTGVTGITDLVKP